MLCMICFLKPSSTMLLFSHSFPVSKIMGWCMHSTNWFLNDWLVGWLVGWYDQIFIKHCAVLTNTLWIAFKRGCCTPDLVWFTQWVVGKHLVSCSSMEILECVGKKSRNKTAGQGLCPRYIHGIMLMFMVNIFLFIM